MGQTLDVTHDDSRQPAAVVRFLRSGFAWRSG